MYPSLRYYSAYSCSPAQINVVKSYSSDSLRFRSFCSDSDGLIEEEDSFDAAAVGPCRIAEYDSLLDKETRCRRFSQERCVRDKVSSQGYSPRELTNSECEGTTVAANLSPNKGNEGFVSTRTHTRREDEHLVTRKAKKKIEMMSKASSICEFVCSVVESSQNRTFQTEMLNMLAADTMGTYRQHFMNILLENIELRFQ
uniref:Uncharacterized protein n=1 Tax=Trichuris muris TaxID=70415 RepID=A0A5S6Q5T8_TRIMR